MASPERKNLVEKIIDVGNTLDVVTFIWGAVIGNIGLMTWSIISFGAGKLTQSQIHKKG